MLTKVPAFVVLAAVVLFASACGERGGQIAASTSSGPPGQVELQGLSGDRARVMEQLVERLGSDTMLQTVRLVPPPADVVPRDETTTGGGEPAWLLISPREGSSDPAEQFRARWQAAILLAAYWRELNAQGDHGLRGGELVQPEGFDAQLRYFFEPDSSKYLFTNETGRPSPLTADQDALEHHIASEARNMGLIVTKLAFGGVEGTTVDVEVVATNPAAFIEAFGRSYGDLLGDPGAVEGVLLTIRDPEGALIKQSSYTTGLKGGASVIGERYQKYFDY